MPFKYEVVVQRNLSDLFLRDLLQYIYDTKSCEMFRLASSPNIWEFKQSKDVFTLSYSEESEERERIIIESATLDLSDIIIKTLQKGTSDYLITLMAPLTKMPHVELQTKIENRLQDLKAILS